MNDSETTPVVTTHSPSEPANGGSPEFSRDTRWVAHKDLYLEHQYWTNPRSVSGLDDEELRGIAESIRSGTVTDETGKVYAGIRVALDVVMVKSNGGFINLVIDGQRRHIACKLAGLPGDVLIPVVDLRPEPVDLTPELASELLIHALQSVAHRAGLSSYELAQNAAKLRVSKNPDTGKEYTLAEIGRAIDKSESWVSKMLAAMKHATPKLIACWRDGEITDEMFKDAAVVKSADNQEDIAKKAVDARKSGDKGSARTLAREQKLIAKQEEKAAKPATGAKPAPKAPTPAAKGKGEKGEHRVVRGPQAELPIAPSRKPPPFVIIEDTLDMAVKRPPTHDYVRGIMDGVRWASGLMDPGAFGKPWHAYLSHVQGQGQKQSKAPSKAPPKPKAARKDRKPKKK